MLLYAPMTPGRYRTNIFAPLLMVVVVGLIYAHTLKGPFVLDDIRNIRDNPHLRLSTLSPDGIFSAGLKSPSANRPVANISFALNYYFHDDNPLFYRLVNIVIHITTGLLLFLLTRTTLSLPSLGYKQDALIWVPFFTALVWLVHPIQTESVSYIVQRMNSMAALFYVLSLVLYVKARLATAQAKKWLLFSGCVLSGALAIGSKEIAATLPFFIFLYEWYFFQDLRKGWFKNRLVPFLGISALFCCIAFVYLGPHPLEKLLYFYETRAFTVTERVLTQFRVVLFYVSLLVLPHPSRLNLDHDFSLSYSLFDPVTTLLSVGTLAGLVVVAISTARRHRLVSFCILWFVGNLVIESSVIGLEIIFEHRIYLPSMVFCLLAVSFLYRLIKPQRLAVLLLSLIVALCSFWTYERNSVWGDDVTLWRDCVAKSPGKARPRNNLGLALLEREHTEEAIVHFSEALRIRPEYAEAHNNLGMAFADQGRLKQAMRHYYEAVKIDPGLADAYYNLGNVLMKEGSTDEAISHYVAAIRINPHFAEAHNNLGISFVSRGRLEEAIGHFIRALEIKPDHANARGNLEKASADLERIKKDIADTNRLLKRSPEDAALHCTLGSLLFSKGAAMEAIVAYEKALALEPNSVQALYSLAMVYTLATKEYKKALRLLYRTVRLQPDMVQAYYSIASLYARQGKRERTLHWLEKAVDLGFNDWDLLKTDRSMENIRGSRYYQELMDGR